MDNDVDRGKCKVSLKAEKGLKQQYKRKLNRLGMQY